MANGDGIVWNDTTNVMSVRKDGTDYELYSTDNLSLSTLGYTGATNANYITNNNQLTNGAGYQNASQVASAVAAVVDSAPGTLDTLNELAAALGDDPNFATTTANNIATKLPLAGGAMTGAITTNSTFDGRDVASLEEEGLANMDAFIAVTGDSEINIMTTLVAKSHDVMKTIARVENIDYIHLSQDIGIDTLINKKMIAASSIFKHVRKGKVDAIAHLHGVNAEIIEFEINENTRVSGKQIKKIKFNNQVKIISIIRNNEILFPEEEEILRPGDKVITMILSQAIGKTENLFS